jgi:hypothetical protein
LIAHDLERSKQGWAGIVEKLSADRKPLYIFPSVRTEDIFTKNHVRGDIIAIMVKKEDGSLEPSVYHLIRLSD